MSLRERVAEKLADPELRRKMARSMGQALTHRLERMAEVPEWEELRDAARDIRAYGLAHLDQLLEQFEANLLRLGAKVHWAHDAASANEYVIKVAREHGVDRLVKGKTMTSEETELNQALVAAGIEPIETDLGEYLIQLAGEKPAHPTAPAAHMSRQDCGRLISEALGVPYTDDPTELTLLVRDALREEFLGARMSATGANFAVAETGSIVIIENEGNQGLCTSLPEVHVALVGIDKLVARLQDLGPLLRLLARSAIGQTLTCYTNLITGPRRETDVDGPRELHVILLDNGRSEMLGDSVGRMGLTCIRCGVCCNICPIYSKVGGHPYGSAYPGPIGSVWAPFVCGGPDGSELAHLSTLCGACGDVCPVRIDLPHRLLNLRLRPAGRRAFGPLETVGMWVLSVVLSRPRLYGMGAKWLRRIMRRPGLVRRSAPGRAWLQDRELPELPERSFQDAEREREVRK